MDKKEINIIVPEGYEIDKENSTFEKIVFKKIKEEPKRWRDDKDAIVKGFFIGIANTIQKYVGFNKYDNYDVFATEKQVKSALAMARISQIMANDERFGGIVTDEEWKDCTTKKYVICRCGMMVATDVGDECYHFLAFHTREQRNLFLEENEDLVKNYLMLD